MIISYSKNILMLIILFFLSSSIYSFDDLSISGSNELHYTLSQDEQTDSLERYFENWTDLSILYKKLTLDFRYEAHLPPAPGSFNSNIRHEITMRTFAYQGDNITIKAGHFYAMLGKGLTLRAYEKRELGWDTKIDGLYFNYLNDKIEVKLLGGIPYSAHGSKYDPLEAIEILATPKDFINFGLTAVITNKPSKNSYWESFYTNINFPFGSLYAEYASMAFEDFTNLKKDKAIYISSNFFIKDLTILAEYKYFLDFDIYEGMTYNNPPTVIKEHLFSLLNKHQLVQNADDEHGFLLDLSYPFINDKVLTLSYAYTTATRIEKNYHDLYAQFEFQLPENIQWIIASGLQIENKTRHINFILYPSWAINEDYTIKFEFQHQHTSIDDQENYKQIPKFYTQAYSITLIKSPNISISLLGETTTEEHTNSIFKIANNGIWLGGEINWRFLENHNINIFGGTRRSGKICAGGICKNKPALNGVELSIISSF